MVRSTPVIGSGRRKKYNPVSYVIYHCIPTGFQSMWEAFRYWRLLMVSDISGYKSFDFLSEGEKFEEVAKDFWYILNEPDTEPLWVLNKLIDLGEEVDSLFL